MWLQKTEATVDIICIEILSGIISDLPIKDETGSVGGAASYEEGERESERERERSRHVPVLSEKKRSARISHNVRKLWLLYCKSRMKR